MHILVINSGSSSLKFSLFTAESAEPESLFEGEASGIGGHQAKAAFRTAAGHDAAPAPASIASMEDTIAWMYAAIAQRDLPKIDAIGYRVVHPGANLREHQRITPAVLDELRKAAVFAPLHDPSAVAIIEQMQRRFSTPAHFACFDTVFHQTMPPEATTYPLPAEYAAKGVRRYGFHGLACESVVYQLRAAGFTFPKRLAIAHLGSGCSVTALVNGQSVDTTMGLTPTGGIVMGTRPGDLDPGLMLYLVRQIGADAVEKMLNHDAGLKALSGISGDMREVREAAANGNTQAELALRVFTQSVAKALGSYMALLGGLDAIVFSGGIGEHDSSSRAEILESLRPFNVKLDEIDDAHKQDGLHMISQLASGTSIYIVPAEEDLMIARHVAGLSQSAQTATP